MDSVVPLLLWFISIFRRARTPRFHSMVAEAHGRDHWLKFGETWELAPSRQLQPRRQEPCADLPDLPFASDWIRESMPSKRRKSRMRPAGGSATAAAKFSSLRLSADLGL